MSAHSVAIVGASHAGVSVAEELRKRGFDGEITLIGAEPLLPYDKPQLSKKFLGELRGFDQLVIHDRVWYEDNGIELHLGTGALHLGDGVVELVDGDSVPADAVVLATGSTPRRLSIAARRSVYYLRTYADSAALQLRLRPGGRAVVIGGGFIGAEFAAVARRAGMQVVLVEALDIPFGRVLGAALGAHLARIHRDEGVEILTGRTVTGVENVGDGVVVKMGEERVEADFAVIGIGVVPNDTLARRSGVAVKRGVLVDREGRASVPGVYAAGDVALFEHARFGRLRSEHYQAALDQGVVVARSILGMAPVYDDIPWFWSDQYELNLQLAGFASGDAEIVIRRPAPDSSELTAFFLEQGRLNGVLGINRSGDVRTGLRIIGSDVSGIVAELGDDSVDLRSLARSRLRAAEVPG